MSMFSRCDKFMNNDPFEEIFALNLGDFLTEHLISDELARKIKNKINSESKGLKEQLRELISIYSIENTLKLLEFKNKDDYVIYNAIAKTIMQMVEVDSCHIFLSKDRMRGKIEKDLFLAGSSVDFCGGEYSYSLGYNLSDNSKIVEAFNTQKTLIGEDIENFGLAPELKQEKTKHYEIYPMNNSQLCVGVIAIEKFSKEKLSEEYSDLISAISSLFATSLQLQTLTEEATVLINSKDTRNSILQHLRAQLTVTIGDLGDEQQRFVKTLAKAVDIKGAYSQNHSQTVANLAKKLCTQLGLNEKTKDLIYYGALLQNIGRITLPQKLFDKKDKLTDLEMDEIKKAPNLGVNILMQINFLAEVIPYVHYHKERWDGKGKPEGLKGQSIPFGSRIIAVADAYCALTVERPYREKFSDEKAIEIISNEAGSKWDPAVVQALIEVERC